MNAKNTFLFISCKEAANCCDKAQYEEASALQRLKLMVHLFICKTCRKYSSNNAKLTGLIKKSDLETCNETNKQIWREEINRRMAENSL